MSDIKFNCPECGGALEVDASGAGMTVNCPDCKKPICIPKPVAKIQVRQPISSPSARSQSEKPCPLCGESILAVAKKCKHCGSMLDGSGTIQKVNVAEKDPFAEYHTDIKGKKAGKLSGIGIMGVILGVVMMLASIASCFATDDIEEGQNIFVLFMVGLGFSIASYLWARKK